MYVARESRKIRIWQPLDADRGSVRWAKAGRSDDEGKEWGVRGADAREGMRWRLWSVERWIAGFSCKLSSRTQTNRQIASLPLCAQLPKPFLASNRKSPLGPGSRDPATSTATILPSHFTVPPRAPHWVPIIYRMDFAVCWPLGTVNMISRHI